MYENTDAYNAKIRNCMNSATVEHTCPKCGKKVGLARKVDGKTYLAETFVSPNGTLYAKKSEPHFLNCAGSPEPGVLCKGVSVKVVRGRKVPKGTEGVIVWIGISQFGERCGIKDASGNVHWTALTNVEAVTKAENTK